MNVRYYLEGMVSLCDACTNVLAVTNMGVNSLSKKKTTLTIKNGKEKHPRAYSLGCISGCGVELAFFMFSTYEITKGNPWYFFGDLTAKGIGFTLGYNYESIKNLTNTKQSHS